MTTHLSWRFPLPEPGCGINLGNGTLGLMVWGGDSLIVTIGRNGFWDRRNAVDFLANIHFHELRELLEARDQEGQQTKLGKMQAGQQAYRKPTQIPGGRIQFVFERPWRPEDASLELSSGKLTVRLLGPAGETATASIQISMDSELALVGLSDNTGPVKARAIPSWDFIGELLAKDGVAEPSRWEEESCGGFHQSLPADPGLTLAYSWKSERLLALATGLGNDATAVRREVESLEPGAFCEAMSRSGSWWRDYFQSTPALDIPDNELSDAYFYGLVKLAGLTAPSGVAATLAGPFMDDNTLPGWSNDYHFDVNAQMIYWPVLATNRTSHLEPLWKMMREWLPRLKENGSKFYGAPEALMLPAAVNDRCQVVDTYWQGFLDIGSTAWMGQLAWLHYRHTLDTGILREIAWPLVSGAFEAFYAMSERIVENGKPRLSLPVSVSPEYGSGFDSLGRDSSYSLAAFHMTAKILIEAAHLLGKPSDPRWQEVEDQLPPYSTIVAPNPWNPAEKIRHMAIWEGQDLDESHRHHSALAGIYPFKTIDPFDPAHKKVMADTLQHWIQKGAGNWVGFSLPWASSLCSYCGMPDGAIFWLKYDLGLYFNAGGNSDCNGDFVGVSFCARDYILNPKDRYCAQIICDDSMGVITALLDILVQTRGDRISVLPALPRKWRDFSFDGVLTEGAFRIGATVKDWKITEIRIESIKGARIDLLHGLGDAWTENGAPRTGAALSRATVAGETITLRRLIP
ncbi:MAG: glycoside hydrolase family 95-like protein [Verrucomicrobiae bacterium]